MITKSLAGSWKFRKVDQEAWFEGTVPGGVHTDLLTLGQISDPFFGDNEKSVQWVAESDWEYQKEFSVEEGLIDHDKVFLVFDGLDTLASVILNGIEVGRADNMFRQYRWEVKSLLARDNVLTICFPSPIKYISKKQEANPLKGVSEAIPGGPYLRKAPCQFGWDWGPKLPPIGVWKDVRLEGRSGGQIRDVHLRQVLDDDQALVRIRTEIDAWSESDFKLEVTIKDPMDEVIFQESKDIKDAQNFEYRIDEPELWYPNGYGRQPLYSVLIKLIWKGGCVDTKTYKIGLRKIELVQEPDEWGRSFTFIVNGIPIFAKGSNWIPADSFPTRLSDDFMEHLIKSAADSHQNMLRVWGGGLYEEERFYDLCDKYGILVWQDFIFSCSIYPLDEEEFLENVKQEVFENVRRIRHRASLALWCGNNEMEWGWEAWGWSKPEIDAGLRDQLDVVARQFPIVNTLLEHFDDLEAHSGWKEQRDAYDGFFHRKLQAWVAELDPDTPYWPSSPSSETPFQDVNGQVQGDAHYWEVWHGRKPFSAYRSQYPRFMSEFGFQSLPPLKTIAQYAEEKDWNMTSYIMEHHQRSKSGNGLMVAQMTDTFRMPINFPALVYLSMVLQAEGIRYGVEHWRRNRHRVSGTLYWQLNDCWPVASWSSLDYFGRWKALHYAVKRFYAPILLSVEDEGKTQRVFLTNDLNSPVAGRVIWTLETLRGEVLDKGNVDYEIEGGRSEVVLEKDFSTQVTGDLERELVFVSELITGDGRHSWTVTPFTANKYLELERPNYISTFFQEGGKGILEIGTDTLARFVEISYDNKDITFSDNYFDIPAGRSILISFDIPVKWDLSVVKEKVKLRSLYDSYH
jgi:beta-mannosidase